MPRTTDSYDRPLSEWKQFRHGLEELGVRLFAEFAPRIPRPWVEGIARGLGNLTYYVDQRGRRAARENLRCAFGDDMPESERRRTARRCYGRFARTFFDLFWGRRLTAENYREFAEIEFEDPESERLAMEGGAIWITPHYGSFEWISLIWGFRGFPFVVIAQAFKNPALTEIFGEARGSSGHEILPQKGSMLRLLRHLKRGGHAAFLTDLNVKPDQASAVIQAFGLKTCVTVMHAALAKRTGLPIIPGIALPEPDGRTRIKILRPIIAGESESHPDIAQRCWDAFEKEIRAVPEPWIWMYKHWRYLPEGEDAKSYPAYANRSKKFDKLMRNESSWAVRG